MINNKKKERKRDEEELSTLTLETVVVEETSWVGFAASKFAATLSSGMFEPKEPEAVAGPLTGVVATAASPARVCLYVISMLTTIKSDPNSPWISFLTDSMNFWRLFLIWVVFKLLKVIVIVAFAKDLHGGSIFFPAHCSIAGMILPSILEKKDAAQHPMSPMTFCKSFLQLSVQPTLRSHPFVLLL